MTEYTHKFNLLCIDPQDYQVYDFLATLYDKFHLMHHIVVWHEPDDPFKMQHAHIFLRFKSEISTIAVNAVARCFFEHSSLDPVPLVSVPCFLRSTFLSKDLVTSYATDDHRWLRSCLACDPSLKEAVDHV